MTEREQFEAEYRKRSDRDDDDVEESLRLGKDGEYLYDGTWTAFYWWQAASAKSPQVHEGMALVPVDALNSIMELAGVALVYQPFGTKDRQHFDALLAAKKENQNV